MNLPTSIIGKNFRVLCWMALAIPLWTCKHPPGPDSDQCGEATTIDEMMEWIYFKSGTYWVYEEETTGELDTLTVVAHGDGVHAGTNYRWFSYDVVSSRDGYNYYWWFSESYSTSCPHNENCYCNKLLCSKAMPGNAVGEGLMFMFPLYVGNWMGVGWGAGDGGLASIIGVNTQVSVLDDTSTLTASIFNIDNSVCDDWTEADYFLAKGYGIVKKILPEKSESWILKEILVVN